MRSKNQKNASAFSNMLVRLVVINLYQIFSRTTPHRVVVFYFLKIFFSLSLCFKNINSSEVAKSAVGHPEAETTLTLPQSDVTSNLQQSCQTAIARDKNF